MAISPASLMSSSTSSARTRSFGRRPNASAASRFRGHCDRRWCGRRDRRQRRCLGAGLRCQYRRLLLDDRLATVDATVVEHVGGTVRRSRRIVGKAATGSAPCRVA